MVHFPGFARAQLWIHWAVRGFYPCGFPHSEIPGSMPACGSPRLIAACHVLHRLLLPRHPPCALSSLTIKFTRHIAASPPAFSYQPSALSKSTTRRANSMGLVCLLLARDIGTASRSSRPLRLLSRSPPEHSESEMQICLRTPAGFSLGTHKNLQPCRLPNLFSCQISSSEPSLAQPGITLPKQVWVLLDSEVCKLRKSFQPNVRRQATFLNREQNHGCHS